MRILKNSPTAMKRLFEILGGKARPLEHPSEGAISMDFYIPRDIESISPGEFSPTLADGYLDEEVVVTMLKSMIADGRLTEVPIAGRNAGNGDNERDVALAACEVIARFTAKIAGDVAAFGSYAPAYQLADGRSVVQILLDACDSLTEIRELMAGKRTDYIRSQFETLKISRESRNLKLHIGAGPSILTGFVNIDFAPAQLAMNTLWNLPIEDGGVDFIFMAHLFEHIHYRGEALTFLKEARRLLSSGGVIRIVVPDTELLLESYAKNDKEFFDVRRNYWPHQAVHRTRMESVLRYSGAGLRAGDFFRHKYGYDYETMKLLLEDAGFTGICRSEYMASSHPDLRVDNHSPTAGMRYKGRPFDLFVEASSP